MPEARWRFMRLDMPTTENLTQDAPPEDLATTHPDPGGGAAGRLWPLSPEAHGRRPRRPVRDGVQGWARHAGRRGADQGAGRAHLDGGAAAQLRQRPLG